MVRPIIGYEAQRTRAVRSFLRRRAVVGVLLAVLVFLGVSVLLPSLTARDFGLTAQLEVDVCDAATGRAIGRAGVVVLNENVPVPPSGSLGSTTDSTGHLTATIVCGGAGYPVLPVERVRFESNYSIQVAAPGYVPTTVRVPRYGTYWRLFKHRTQAALHLKVDLRPAPTTQTTQ